MDRSHPIPGVAGLADDVQQCLALAKTRGPLKYQAEIEQQILRYCPEFETSWGLAYVSKLCVQGRLPEYHLAEALADFAYQRSRANQGLRRPMIDPRSYLAGVLKRYLARVGIRWKQDAIDERENKTA